MRIVLCIVFLELLIFPNTSCKKISAVNNLPSSSNHLALPADWPIPQLAFTKDVTLTRRPSPGSKMALSDCPEWTSWFAYVHCDGGRIAIAKHVEFSLAPLGYQRVAHENDKDDIRNKWRMYYSSDGILEVSITDDVTQGLTATPDQIADTAKKWHDGDAVALANVKDFMIMINVFKSPPIPYTQLLDGTYSSGNYLLVPITTR